MTSDNARQAGLSVLIEQLHGVIADARGREQTLLTISVTDLDDVLLAAQSADASNAATGQGLTDEQIAAIFLKYRERGMTHTGGINVQRELVQEIKAALLAAPAAPAPKGWDKIEADESNQTVLGVLSNNSGKPITYCDCLMPYDKHLRSCPIYKERRRESIAASKRLYDGVAAKSKLFATPAPAPAAQASDTEMLDFLDKFAVIAKPGQPVRDAIRAAMAEQENPK